MVEETVFPGKKVKTPCWGFVSLLGKHAIVQPDFWERIIFSPSKKRVFLTPQVVGYLIQVYIIFLEIVENFANFGVMSNFSIHFLFLKR